MRRNVLLGGLVALFVLAGWWFLFISPRNGDIDEAKQQLVVAEDQNNRLRAQISQLEEIQRNEVLYVDALNELDRLIPDRPLLEDFIEQIDTLSTASGVELLTLAPSLPRADEETDLREISLSAQVQGEFFEIMGFLFGLSDMERLVRVDGLALSSTEENGVTELSVSLDMRLFTLADLLPLVVEENGTDQPSDGGGDGGDGGSVEATGEAGS